MDEQDIILFGKKTYESFLSQFEGENDIYKQILIEELIKVIYEQYYKKPWVDEESPI